MSSEQTQEEGCSAQHYKNELLRNQEVSRQVFHTLSSEEC
jgi:hypothetical protein